MCVTQGLEVMTALQRPRARRYISHGWTLTPLWFHGLSLAIPSAFLCLVSGVGSYESYKCRVLCTRLFGAQAGEEETKEQT